MNEKIVRQLFSARSQLLIGNYEAAIQMCQALVDSDSSCLLARRILALAAAELGRIDQAIDGFRTCSLIDPEDEVAHVGLALCAEAQGDHVTATEEFCRALELAPMDAWIADEVKARTVQGFRTPLMEARIALAGSNPVRALMLLGEIIDDGNLAVELTRAHALWDLGRVDAVWDLCWRISRQHPSCVGALVWLKVAGVHVDKPLYGRMAGRLLEQITPGLGAYTQRVITEPNSRLSS